MEYWNAQEWNEEIAALNSAVKKSEDEEAEAQPLNKQEQAVLDHVAWRVARTAWGNPKRFSEEAAEATFLQKSNVKKGRQKVRNATKILERWMEPTRKENEKELKECPPHVAKVLQTKETRNIAGFRKLEEHYKSGDTTLADDIKFGFPDFRDLTRSNTIPRRETPKKGDNADKPLSSFRATIANLRRLKKPGFDDSLLEIVLKEIEEDAAMGRYDKISASEVHFRPALAFPVVQGEKVRVCIDERLRNSYLIEQEKIRLSGTAQVLESISAFLADVGQESLRKRFPVNQTPKEVHLAMQETLGEWYGGRPGSVPGSSQALIEEWINERNRQARAKGTGTLPGLALEDFSKWYFQFAVRGEVESNVRAWDPAENENTFFRSWAMNMGNAASVHSAVRLANFVMHVALRMAGIIVLLYIDDGIMVCHPMILDDAIIFYRTLAKFLGLELSLKSAKLKDGGYIRILGLLYVADMLKKQMHVIVPRAKRMKTLQATWELVKSIRQKSIVMKDVQRVLGNAAYICGSQRCRAGSLVMRLIYPWTVDTTFDRLKRDRGSRRKLIAALAMLTVLVEFRDPIILSVESVNAQFTYIFTDASTNGGPNGEPMIGALVLGKDGRAYAFSWILPEERDTEIDLLEAWAVLVTMRLFHDVLQGSHIWVAVDNSCALYLLIKCSSKKERTAKVGAEVCDVLKDLNSSAYYDYIRTELNPGDYASRSDLLRKLQDTFAPIWRQPEAWMLNTDSWDDKFRGALKRPPTKMNYETLVGGKRMRVETELGPLHHRYILL